ncbi:MAG: response regulator [Endomicrobia bacterium]|nr:response regulator [Endomicrobiia bacterium]
MKKILIVDDDLEIQDLLKFSFEQLNYEVIQSYNGIDALKKVEQYKPDLIVLDVMMPEMNGFEVIEKLRSKIETCLIPVVMLTSLGQPKDKLTGIKLGADDYLVKPVDPYELISCAENLIKKYYENVNAITRLLGLNSLENDIKDLLKDERDFTLMLLDIINFSAYNLKYGYEKGDVVLKFFSSILRSSIASYGSKFDSLYHIESDKFAIITFSMKPQLILENITPLFDDLSKKIYDDESLSKSCFISNLPNRDIELAFPFMKIATAVVKVDSKKYKHFAEVITYTKEILNIAREKNKKSNDHSVIIV